MKFNLQAIRKKNPKRALYLKKKLRIRKKITGSNVRPRLCIFKSIKAIHVQAINDKRGITLASASSYL